MAETNIITYQDAVEHALDLYDLDRTARNLRQAKRAVLAAYNRIPELHHWSYYRRPLQIRTEASQEGTATYDHTGGTYERMLTLASGTWPTNAHLGKVILSSQTYPIEDRKSSTVVTLPVDFNPGADLTAVSYTWYRSSYTLPMRFRQCNQLVETSTGDPLTFVTPDELLHINSASYSPQRSWAYSIHNTSDYYGTLEVQFAPPPDSARTFDFIAHVAPRQLRTELYSTGTVTVTAGSTSVTGSGTAFSSDHIGSIIRFTTSTSDLPTAIVGSSIPDPSGLVNVYISQRTIMDVSSATALTTDNAAHTANLSGTKYTISDPIDIEPHAMLSLFYRLCEEEMSRLVRAEDVQMRQGITQMALRTAMGADNRNPGMVGGNYPTYTSRVDYWDERAIII